MTKTDKTPKAPDVAPAAPDSEFDSEGPVKPVADTVAAETPRKAGIKSGLSDFALSSPNTCHDCGDGPFTAVYATSEQAAISGKGLCAKCAAK